MPTSLSVDVRGADAVSAALRRLSATDAKRALQKASTEAAKELKKTVKAEAPRGPTGNLKRSISGMQAKRDRPAAIVKPRSKVAPHRHLVINGTGVRRPKRGQFIVFQGRSGPVFARQVRGVAPNPFVTRGYQRGRGAADRAIERVMKDFVETAARGR